MRRITPTGWGQTGGREIALLGSTEAVLEAIGAGGYIVVSGAADGGRVLGIADKLGIVDIRLIYASHGAEGFFRVPDDATVGVDVNAWHGSIRGVWDVTEAIIKRRFPKAVWG